jgi:crotonobetainyl-CoA:carnitine CoA-transferase CaiB-like acyl-CoA transferase
MGDVATRGVCDGLRVLDFTQGRAGPLATMILADFGAEVVRVEPVGGDPGWATLPYALLNRGKSSVDLDVEYPGGVAEVLRLIPGFDVLIENGGPGWAEAHGLGYETLRAINPGLVVCSISPFGTTGPLASVQADDGAVMAKAGIYRNQPGWRQEEGEPIYRGSRDASYFAAMLSVQGILAALRARLLTGEGQLVETTLVQSITCRQNPNVGWLLREGEELPVGSIGPKVVVEAAAVNALPHHLDPRKQTLVGLMAECGDGRWIMHSQAQPHFFPAWIDAIGFEWIWEDERFKGAPHQFAQPEDSKLLLELIKDRLRERSAVEWMEIYVANGNVCAEMVQTTSEALAHPHVVAAPHIVTVKDPRVGTTTQVGPLARIPDAPASVHRGAPVPGQDTSSIVGQPVRPIAPSAGPHRSLRTPLEGITILEAAYYYATPFATSLLSELGARVIKIEPMAGDPYRRVQQGPDPVRNLGQNNMVRAMQGKESIVLDLKHPSGQEILHRLVAQADVFVHNFRPGVPESLGIDPATLQAINPKLVYQYAAAYGSDGPYASQPAIDPVIAAFSGQIALQTGEGNPPLMENGADPIAAGGHATAMMLGILARERTGRGQYVESAMVVSNLYANCEDALVYEGKPPRPSVDGQQYGTDAARRLYRAAETGVGESGWVFLDAASDAAFEQFCDVIGRADLGADPRFASFEVRALHRAELEQILEDVFTAQPARAWEEQLLAAGVACVQADAMSHFAFLYEDPQARAIGMMTQTEHPTMGGTYWRHAPVIKLSATPGQAKAFCDWGEHSQAILEELGYEAQQIDELDDAGIIGRASERTATAART